MEQLLVNISIFKIFSYLLAAVFFFVALRIGLSSSKWLLRPVKRFEQEQHVIVHWFIRLIRYGVASIVILFLMIFIFIIVTVIIYSLGIGYLFKEFFDFMVELNQSPRI